MDECTVLDLPIHFDNEWNVSIADSCLHELRRRFVSWGYAPVSHNIDMINTAVYNMSSCFAYWERVREANYNNPFILYYFNVPNLLLNILRRLNTMERVKNPATLFDFFIEWIKEREDSIMKMRDNNIDIFDVIIDKFSEHLKSILEQEK